MEDINNYIKENDTDNVTLNKLKELGTKLTGQENVQGETVSEVLDFINKRYFEKDKPILLFLVEKILMNFFTFIVYNYT